MPRADGASASLLDAGNLPIEDLARLAEREGRRPRPIYQAHKWFARRLGTAFRALLTAGALPDGSDFWQGYYTGVDWSGHTALDPFVGGGTSVVEALRLGADVIGVDVDAVACAITRFETRAAKTPDLLPALARLRRAVGERLAPFYRTTLGDGTTRTVLHFFWVQVVDCGSCGRQIEAHPHFQLAYDAEGTRQWAFCPGCHAVQELDRRRKTLRCAACARTSTIQAGVVRFGRLTCPDCGARERLIDVAARTGAPPTWRIFALETLERPASGRSVPLAHRSFRPATAADQATFASAAAALAARAHDDGGVPWIPERLIPPDDRADDRLVRYGYRRYRELFNPRQLLHLSCLAEAIAATDGGEREGLALAFSDHLTTNCMLTHYAFGWRRLAPLFSVRAFRHVTRPVEVNPWLEGTGRGTFPNAVRQVQRAVAFDRAPKEPLLAGGFRSTPSQSHGRDQGVRAPTSAILHRSAEQLDLEDGVVDLVLTDPPYFDNIAYSELSDFFLPWLQLLDLAAADGAGVAGRERNLAAKRRDAAAVARFGGMLGACFREVARVLKPDGRLVFTYQHHTAGAWGALGTALATAGLRPVQLFPLLGDGRVGLHAHEGSSGWDAVFVAVPAPGARVSGPLTLSPLARDAARAHCAYWAARLRAARVGFHDADRRNFLRACLVAGALGLFPDDRSDATGIPLLSLLADEAIAPVQEEA